MSRCCTICFHPDKLAIEAALLDQHMSFRLIAARWGLTTTSLQRHRHTHLAQALRESQELQRMLTTENLLNKLSVLDDIALELLAEARKAGDIRAALLAVKESRSNVEVFAKLGPLGEVEGRLARLEARATEDRADDGDGR